MYSYIYDEETGGILLTSTPSLSNYSKEPRPVYADELNLFGFNKAGWNYENQSKYPYLWAEGSNYIYRGKIVAKLTGGDIFTPPKIVFSKDENGNPIELEPDGQALKQIDIDEMVKKNKSMMNIIEDSTIKKIVSIYEKYKDKLDIFHVAYSGGKDSIVLVDLVQRALPKKSFVVIFADTEMEFPDTYKIINKMKEDCNIQEIPFYTSKSDLTPDESWKLFGPPARVQRWCCSVHKSTPQTLKLREITGKNNYIGMDFVGVRRYESNARNKYQYENYGKKQKSQFSYNAILEWTSAEVWLYIFAHGLQINEAYKKGCSRVGCLLCPAGGNRGDFVQNSCYPKDVKKYISLIKMMNLREKGDEKRLQTYISNGGWNARKNGRDLINGNNNYKDEIKNNSIVITVTTPKTDWKQWLKTMGDIPFEYTIKEFKNGYQIRFDASLTKKIPTVIKNFKSIFHKASSCVKCRVCEANCKFGCISFLNGLQISNCQHCGQCLDIPNGCLVYHSLRTPKGEQSMKKGSINSFANHAPKLEWIRDFYETENDFWEINSLGPNQKNMFKRFLRDSGLITDKAQVTNLFHLTKKLGWDSNSSWGLLLSNLAYNPQFRWYIENMEVGEFYNREYITDLLQSHDVSKTDTTSIIDSYKRFSELPLGTIINWCSVVLEGKKVTTLSRNKSIISDNKVILYSLIKFVEKCGDCKEFTLSWLMDDTIEKEGISPTKIFGLNYEDMKSILLGLTATYPKIIDATFTNDLNKITINNINSEDILKLFSE